MNGWNILYIVNFSILLLTLSLLSAVYCSFVEGRKHAALKGRKVKLPPYGNGAFGDWAYGNGASLSTWKFRRRLCLRVAIVAAMSLLISRATFVMLLPQMSQASFFTILCLLGLAIYLAVLNRETPTSRLPQLSLCSVSYTLLLLVP